MWLSIGVHGRVWTATVNSSGQMTEWVPSATLPTFGKTKDVGDSSSSVSAVPHPESSKTDVKGSAPMSSLPASSQQGFPVPKPELARDIAAMTLEERLQRAEAARGGLVKIWRDKAACDGKGKDFRSVISGDCMPEIPNLMKDVMEMLKYCRLFCC